METGAEMGAAEPDAALALQAPKLLLRLQGREIEDGMIVEFAAKQGVPAVADAEG
jgi:hypothetical protein